MDTATTRRPDYEIYSDISWNSVRKLEETNGYGHGAVIKSNRNSQIAVRAAWCPTPRHNNKVGTYTLELQGMFDSAVWFMDTHARILDADRPVTVTIFCDNTGSVDQFNAAMDSTDQKRLNSMRRRHDISVATWNRVMNAVGIRFRAVWIKGHASNKYNNLADVTARTKRKEMEPAAERPAEDAVDTQDDTPVVNHLPGRIPGRVKAGATTDYDVHTIVSYNADTRDEPGAGFGHATVIGGRDGSSMKRSGWVPLSEETKNFSVTAFELNVALESVLWFQEAYQHRADPENQVTVKVVMSGESQVDIMMKALGFGCSAEKANNIREKYGLDAEKMTRMVGADWMKIKFASTSQKARGSHRYLASHLATMKRAQMQPTSLSKKAAQKYKALIAETAAA